MALEAETPLRELEFKPEEMKMLTGFMFLTRKPMLYVLNLGDEEASEIDRVIEKYQLEKLASKPQTAVVPFCGKIEAELAELDDAEASEMMKAYGLKESGRDRLIQASYRLLGLISFLTCGEPECRAWTIERGMTAQKAAGAIHSDIEKEFHQGGRREVGGPAQAQEASRRRERRRRCGSKAKSTSCRMAT